MRDHVIANAYLHGIRPYPEQRLELKEGQNRILLKIQQHCLLSVYSTSGG